MSDGTIPAAITEPPNIGLPKLLTTAICRGECILFLGSGIHAASSNPDFYYPEEVSLPRGSQLAEWLVEECELLGKNAIEKDSIHDLQRVALSIESESTLRRQALVELLKERLVTNKEPSPALLMLASMPFSYIVTTNYDMLFEKALRMVGKEPQILCYVDEEVPRPQVKSVSPDSPLVFYIHGCLSNDRASSLVITDEDYIKFIQRMTANPTKSPIPARLDAELATSSVLFIGYSLRDYNLRLLFRTLTWNLDYESRATTSLSYSIDKKPDRLIVDIYENKHRYLAFLERDFWKVLPGLSSIVRTDVAGPWGREKLEDYWQKAIAQMSRILPIHARQAAEEKERRKRNTRPNQNSKCPNCGSSSATPKVAEP